MIKGCGIVLCVLVLSNQAFAGSMGSDAPLVDKQYFVGIGGSYNSPSLNPQSLYGKGVTNAFLGSTLTSTGSAAGYSNPFYKNETIFSPHVQAGYLQYFRGGVNFWGAKLSYDYLDVHFSENNMTIAQAGSNYNVLTDVTTDLTGNYAVESVQTSFNHELLLLALVGHSFEHSNVYFGIGPSLLEVQSDIYHLIGYADYKGMQGTNMTGVPVNLSHSTWVWGAAAQVGVTYSLNSSWFLDFNYTYAGTAKNTIKYTSPFTNQIGVDTVVGTSYINSSQQPVVQSFSVSINTVF